MENQRNNDLSIKRAKVKQSQRNIGRVLWKFSIVLFFIAFFLAGTPDSQPFSIVVSIFGAAIMISGTILVSE